MADATDQLDPGISLGLKPPAAPANPLSGMLETYLPLARQSSEIQYLQTETQSRQLGNTLVARQIAAQSKSAEYARQSTNPDGTIDFNKFQTLMFGDPLTAANAGSTMAAVREGQLAYTRQQGELQTQGEDFLTNYLKAWVPAAAKGDLKTLSTLPNLFLQNANPQVRERLAPVLDNFNAALLSDLPGTPGSPEWLSALRDQTHSTFVTSGLSPEQRNAIYGEPKSQETPASIQPGVLDPFTGNWSPRGPIIPKPPAPFYTQPGTGGGAFLGGVAPGSNIFSPSIRPTNSLTGAFGGAAPAGGGNALGAAPAPERAFDGAQLYDSAKIPTKSAGLMNPIQLQAEKDTAEQLFGKEGSQQYVSTVNSLGLLHDINRNVDLLAAKGGFTTPGALGNSRLDFANFLNTLSKSTGFGQVVDPTAIASGEDLIKDTIKSGFANLSSAFGIQREGQETVKNAIRTVPGIENTPLGARMVSAVTEAVAQHQIDQYKFQQSYFSDPRNGGQVTGSAIEFNKQHSIDDYIQRALGGLGFASDGSWKDVPALNNAVAKKWITGDQAAKAARAQWGKTQVGDKIIQ